PHLAGGARDRVAGRHEGAARERAGTPVETARVAGHDGDVARLAPQRLRRDLRERRLVALTLRGEAGRDGHAAARLDAHVRALVRSDAGALDIACDPQAEVASLVACGALPLAEFRNADALQRHLEPRRVVAAVVARRSAILERQAYVPRKLVRLDEIPSPHVARLQVKLARDAPDHPLHDERAVRPSGPTIRR